MHKLVFINVPWLCGVIFHSTGIYKTDHSIFLSVFLIANRTALLLSAECSNAVHSWEYESVKNTASLPTLLLDGYSRFFVFAYCQQYCLQSTNRMNSHFIDLITTGYPAPHFLLNRLVSNQQNSSWPAQPVWSTTKTSTSSFQQGWVTILPFTW